MYVIKSKGTSKVPDFVQIRDNNFALIEHIKFSSLEKKIKEFYPNNFKDVLDKILNEEFEKIIEI